MKRKNGEIHKGNHVSLERAIDKVLEIRAGDKFGSKAAVRYVKHRYGGYHVFEGEVCVGEVRRRPHSSPSEINWECRVSGGNEWFGAFETRYWAAWELTWRANND